MASVPRWLGGRRRRDGASAGPVSGLEARPASVTPPPAVRVAGFDGPLPHLDRAVTVVVTTRSDRHAEVPRLVDTAQLAFGVDADVRVVSYVADAAPRDAFDPRLPWVRSDPVDGLGSAINAGVAPGVGRTLVVVDTSVELGAGALVAFARDVGRPTTARVRTADGAWRNGARLLRPGALPWSDDRAATPDDLVFGADQPVVTMPQWAVVPAPCLPDERTTLTAWTASAAEAIETAVRTRDVGDVVRVVEPGRTVDQATVDVVVRWRDRARMTAGRLGSDVVAGPPLPPWGARPVSPTKRSSDPGGQLAWSIKIAAPAGPEGDGWGDVHFAAELAGALERLGQHVRIDRRDAHVRDDDGTDDVTLVIRGLDRVPPNPASVNLLWVISHPDDVTDTELRSFDRAFAAGPVWAADAAERSGVPVRTLLQATDPTVFRPAAASATTEDAGHVVFVGSTRGASRPVVADAVALGADLRVHGPGWESLVPSSSLGSPSLSRDEVARAYASARVVLNDHWPDMAAGGFVSNRVFDVLASGGVVVTDVVAGLADVLDVPTVAVAASRHELATLLDPARPWPSPAERTAIATRIAAEHSFDARARVLLDAARAERSRLRS
ncbi:glycosyltransferase [Curtobacterium sp. MCPF17_002]|uniref:glycosyltransferase family protein n=1 Tax=Curtobacterium sp. MCPF17_002 TaxID=2175645 RepID=UPI000DA7C3FB|nr:glycosyltransferase [Curtobacterium sp. MCPF17_002]WIB76351.1 glycosyltransferase [Curtobacterium sp. MCPF17_002]